MIDAQSLTKGWRADINTSELGYFRTDDETVRRILSFLSFDPSLEDPITLFDPCCGEGIALADVQKQFPGSISYGCELDNERFRESSSRLDVVVHGDALDDFVGSPSWASLLFFNPPYGDVPTEDGNTRLEFQFWRRHIDRLQRGGIFIGILPTQLFLRLPHMAKMMAHALEPDSLVYRASTDKFNQLVIIGRRAKTSGYQDLLLTQTLLAVSEHSAEVPEIPVSSHPIFMVPPGKAPQTFHMTTLTDLALQQMFAQEEQNERDFFSQIGQTLQRQALATRQRSIMPLRDGHVPAVLASGLLDGIVEDESGRYLVKGSVRRAVTRKEEMNFSFRGQQRTRTTVQRAETACFAWDLNKQTLLEVK